MPIMDFSTNRYGYNLKNNMNHNFFIIHRSLGCKIQMFVFGIHMLWTKSSIAVFPHEENKHSLTFERLTKRGMRIATLGKLLIWKSCSKSSDSKTHVQSIFYLISHLIYLQPMFYHLGHFSKFVPPGSKRIDVTAGEKSPLQFIGFVTPGPESSTVVIILNTEDQEIALQIHFQDGMITETVPPSSIQTYIW